jgi:hypothetical protein
MVICPHELTQNKKATRAWWLGVTHLRANRKQREDKGLGTQYSLQRHTYNNLTPPAKSHLPKFP